VSLKKSAGSRWRWVEGIVSTCEDHIKIRYGEESEPVALLAPGTGKSFTVQFLLSQNPLKTNLQTILREVRRELDFYLVELQKPDPWPYAIYHCGTTSNVYSQVHWGYYPKGFQDPPIPQG